MCIFLYPDSPTLPTVDCEINFCTSEYAPFSDPALATVAIGDGDVSDDVPRVGLEEMLGHMTISDSGRETDIPSHGQ